MEKVSSDFLSHPIAFTLIVVFLLVTTFWLDAWVARDAKARCMDNGHTWVGLVRILNLVGLWLYLFARPEGELVPCASCGNRRLASRLKCPHCGVDQTN
jgi:hypothetical protein